MPTRDFRWIQRTMPAVLAAWILLFFALPSIGSPMSRMKASRIGQSSGSTIAGVDSGRSLWPISIDYPENGSIFPLGITPPAFLWRDAGTSWSIEILFAGNTPPIHVHSKGERMRIGAVDPDCVGNTDDLPKLILRQTAGLDLALAQHSRDSDPARSDNQQASPQSLYEQAGKALDAGKTAVAIKLYEELLRQVPDSVEARTNLGAALAQEGRYDEAVQQYRQALSRDPQNETVLLNLALAFYKQGDFSKARSELDTLHKLHPANQQAFYLLADCELRLGKFQDAIALLEPAYNARPDDPALEYILGTALIQDGQTQKGAAVIDRIMRNGNSAVAGVLIGASQYAAGDYKLAAATLEKALAGNPEIPGAWTLYGRALLSNGENEKAKGAFQRALQADPNDFDACLHLGALLRHDGDAESAEPYLKHAAMLRPDSAPALFQIAALQAATGRLEEARSGFEKLVKQWPDFVEAHLQLALVYSRLHRTQDSERERRIVVELNDKERVKGPQPEVIP